MKTLQQERFHFSPLHNTVPGKGDEIKTDRASSDRSAARRTLVLLLTAAFFIASGCKEKETTTQQEDNSVWDIEKKGLPKFVAVDYIEPGKIYRISKFRSSVGHDYSDAFEHCRSMKHYYEPYSDSNWAAVRIFAPVSGTITRLEQEWAGTKIEIESDTYRAFRFSIFHVNMNKSRAVNDRVTAGEELGTHIGSQTMSDIAVIVNDPTRQGRMVSYFDVITDGVFAHYSARGVAARSSLIISQQARDAAPLTCSGDAFISGDTLQNWVVLH